ncbi:MAG: CRISPR-associated endonuclease Cas1, partial [Gammaproteobacteria bacterium]|nr:CRISPR-associated endonuclease Cas1 [Gammaproteobacteria bacterium]
MWQTAMPDIKPLYLNPTTATRVLLDGRSLRVRMQAEADRLFPLKRLSRIMVNCRVIWATNALLACAQAGIPVHFVRHDGTLCA